MRIKVCTALIVIGSYLYVFPIFNWYVAQSSIDKFVGSIPGTLATKLINIPSLALPALKDRQIRALAVRGRKGFVFVLGNSTQFKLSTNAFSTGFGCRVTRFYNFGFSGAEPFSTLELARIIHGTA